MQAYSTIPIICPPALQLIAHFLFLFFFNDTATTEIYTLSLHDALPIFEERSFGYYLRPLHRHRLLVVLLIALALVGGLISWAILLPTLPYTAQAIVLFKYNRSEEHTSELQSHSDLVCRLLLEKKKIYTKFWSTTITARPARTDTAASAVCSIAPVIRS